MLIVTKRNVGKTYDKRGYLLKFSLVDSARNKCLSPHTADRSILMYFMFAAEIGNGSFMRTASSYSHIINAPTTRIGVEKGPNTKRTVDIVDALFFQPYSQTLTAFSTRYLLFRLRVAIIRLS